LLWLIQQDLIVLLSICNLNFSLACSSQMDLVFIVDASNSMRLERFPFILQFIVQIVANMQVSLNQTRIGAIEFSDTAQTIFNLNTYTNQGRLLYFYKLLYLQRCVALIRIAALYRNHI